MKLPLVIGLMALIVVAGVLMLASDFTAYLGNNPETCNNCHVMDAAYEGWYHAGHQDWAACNDCHIPHDFIPKYIVKAQSGFRHVSAFTLGHIPAAIRAHDSSRQVIQENCIRCHTETVANILDSSMAGERLCFECHRDVAHGSRGLSMLPVQHKEENK
ncbi:MAG: cytochrome c nitrite reductase small subunit [Chloroflexota bacterium]|nr:MAG: cytochrome c nitrite reductase small subunit [Chloroflexota bacterium]